jgi:hypothetical protein
MTQVVQHLSSKREVLNLSLNTTHTQKKPQKVELKTLQYDSNIPI